MRPIIAAAMLIAFGAAGYAVPAVAIHPAYAACDPEDHIDKSTANDARRKILAAGYANVHDLYKGCDNVWHGIASKDGREGRVAVEPGPAGKVYPEGA